MYTAQSLKTIRTLLIIAFNCQLITANYLLPTADLAFHLFNHRLMCLQLFIIGTDDS